MVWYRICSNARNYFPCFVVRLDCSCLLVWGTLRLCRRCMLVKYAKKGWIWNPRNVEPCFVCVCECVLFELSVSCHRYQLVPTAYISLNISIWAFLSCAVLPKVKPHINQQKARCQTDCVLFSAVRVQIVLSTRTNLLGTTEFNILIIEIIAVVPNIPRLSTDGRYAYIVWQVCICSISYILTISEEITM